MHYAIDVVKKIQLSRLFMNEWRIMGNVKDYVLLRRVSNISNISNICAQKTHALLYIFIFGKVFLT